MKPEDVDTVVVRVVVVSPVEVTVDVMVVVDCTNAVQSVSIDCLQSSREGLHILLTVLKLVATTRSAGMLVVEVIVTKDVVVVVAAGSVMTELGVLVTLRVALLVTVTPTVKEGTGFFENLPRSVLHRTVD